MSALTIQQTYARRPIPIRTSVGIPARAASSGSSGYEGRDTMSTIRRITAIIAGVIFAATACKGGGAPGGQAAASGNAPAIPVADRIPAGGIAPPANALAAARPAKPDPDAGAALF